MQFRQTDSLDDVTIHRTRACRLGAGGIGAGHRNVGRLHRPSAADAAGRREERSLDIRAQPNKAPLL